MGNRIVERNSLASANAARTVPKDLKRPRWAWAVATVGGVGYLRPGPGTYASVAAVLVWWAMATAMSQQWLWAATVSLAALATIIGIMASTLVAEASGNGDPSFVVIDEVAGQLLALVGAPIGWKSLLAGLILFRAFDIAKPPPLRWLERLPGGWGIMLDDVGAGIYALIVIRLLTHWTLLS